MKFLLLVPLVVLASCSKETVTEDVNAYKEAILRTKNVYSISKNLDKNNPIELKYNTSFGNQLVEFNIEAAKMNNAFISVVNGDTGSKKKRRKIRPKHDVLLAQLKISIDGIDVTQCLISECNKTNCANSDTVLEKFSGEFNTKKMYLNLTKIEKENSEDQDFCIPEGLVSGNSIHILKIEEAGTGFVGAYIKAQVISYNRTFNINSISNAFK